MTYYVSKSWVGMEIGLRITGGYNSCVRTPTGGPIVHLRRQRGQYVYIQQPVFLICVMMIYHSLGLHTVAHVSSLLPTGPQPPKVEDSLAGQGLAPRCEGYRAHRYGPHSMISSNGHNPLMASRVNRSTQHPRTTHGASMWN